jgi:hypothetical protein
MTDQISEIDLSNNESHLKEDLNNIRLPPDELDEIDNVSSLSQLFESNSRNPKIQSK